MPKHSSFARIASFSSVQRARKDGFAFALFAKKLTEILPGASFRGSVRLRLRSEPGARGTTFESAKSRCRSTLRLLESLRFQAYSGLGKTGSHLHFLQKNSPKSYPAPAFAARCGSAFDLSPAPGVPRSRARRVDAVALFVCSNRFVFKRTAGSERRVRICTFCKKTHRNLTRRQLSRLGAAPASVCARIQG